MAQFPNTFEQMMMLDRQRIASFDDALLRNLRLMGSDVPMGNTTFSPGIGFNAPTMYSQVLQGIGGTFGDTAAQTIDLVSGLIRNPAIAPMLGPIPDYLSSVQGLPPIGGAIDPGGFAYSQLYSRIASGREVPQLAPPSNFANRQAIDAYNEQLQNLDYYMMRPSRPEQRLLLPAQNATENMQLATAFENISRMQQQDINFQNMFALFNEIMPGDRAAAISPDMQAQIRQAATRGDEAAIGNILQDPNIRSVLDRQASLAKNASALMGVSSMLSNFVGSTSAETSQVQGLGDILRQVLKLDQPGLMTAATTQSLAAMGNLGIAQTATMGPQGLPETRSVVGQIAAALQERIRMSGMDAQTRGQGSGFFGMQTQGFERTGQLLQELQASGMLTTGGVDIFNAIKPDDVKKMEEAIATQLEGFSEIAKAGRRMGMQIPEITRNLQSIYGGRLPQVLREQAMAEMGGVQAQEMTLVERARERGVSEEAIGLTGSQQRQQFLELEAQRRAGTTMMQQLEKAVELGRFAGIDARGVMAMASTVTQMTQDMGLTGEASMFLTQDALSRVALSRQMGEPITAAQSLAISAGIAERGMKNTSVRSFAALKKAMKDGLPLPQGDVDALIAKFNNNEFVDPDIVSNLIRNAGGIPEAYTSERAMRAAMSDPETMSAVRQRFSSDQNLSVAGTLQRMFESGGAQVDTLVSTVGTNAQLAKQLGIEGDVNFTSIAAAYNRLEGPIAQRDFLTRLEAALPQDQARQITGAFRSLLGANTNNLSVVGDNGRMSPANVILQEESERARFGGQTRAEIGAQAVVDVKRRIEEDMGSGGRTAIADAFKSMMDRAVVAAEQDIKAKGAAGLSDAELQELGRVRATKSVAAGMEAGTIDLTPAQREQLAKLRNIQPDAIDSSLAAAPITNQEAQSLIASKAIDITEAAKAEAAAAKVGTIPLSQAEITQLAERRAASTNFGLSEVLQGLAGTDMGKFSQILGEQITKVKAELGALDQSSSPEMRRQMETELEGLKAKAKAIIDALSKTAADVEYTLKRDLTVVPDSRREMSPEQAAAKAEEQGVDLNELKLGMSGARERRALQPVEKELREMAYSKAIEAGATKQDAEFAAVSSPFTYDDVYAAIERSSLSDEEKASLKSDIKQYKATRESDLQIGEMVVDKNTNQEAERPKALDLDKVTIEGINEATKGAVKVPVARTSEEAEKLNKELTEIKAREAKLNEELKIAAGPRGDVDARRLGLETQLQNLQGLLTQINKYGPQSPEAKAAVQSFVKSLEGGTAVQPEGSPTPQQSVTGQLQGTLVDGTSTAVTTSPSAGAPTAGMGADQPPELLRRDEETSATEVKPLPVAVRPTQTKSEVPAGAAMSPAAQSLALSGEQVGKITSYLQNEMDKKLIGIQQELASLSTHIRSRT